MLLKQAVIYKIAAENESGLMDKYEAYRLGTIPGKTLGALVGGLAGLPIGFRYGHPHLGLLAGAGVGSLGGGVITGLRGLKKREKQVDRLSEIEARLEAAGL